MHTDSTSKFLGRVVRAGPNAETMSRDFIPGRFRDQVALVVGGAQGIGKAIAVRLGREGASVVIADIDRPMMARTVGELASEGTRARQVLCDVRRPRQVNRMVEQV